MRRKEKLRLCLLKNLFESLNDIQNRILRSEKRQLQNEIQRLNEVGIMNKCILHLLHTSLEKLLQHLMNRNLPMRFR